MIGLFKKIKRIFSKAQEVPKPKKAAYKVTRCLAMPSAVGMEFSGQPKANFDIVIRKGKEFRTLKPLEITPLSNGFEIKTKYLEATFEKI